MLDLRLWPTLSLLPLFLGAVLGHPAQQPLLPSIQSSGLPANYTSFELRRYGISSHEDLVHMIDLVHQANIDVWHLTPSHVDVHMDTMADLPLSLANRRYTTLPHSFPYNYDYHPTTTSSSKRPKIDLSSLQDNEFHRTYHTFDEIDQFVVALASQYPKLVEIVWLGASSEERDVFAIRIGKRSRAGHNKGKKHKNGKYSAWETHPFVEVVHHYARNFISRLAELGGLISRGHAITMRDLYSNPRFDAITQSRPIKDRVVIQGAQHAREWIASATALYVAHALVTPEDEPGSLQHLLDKFDFTIIPVPNPDGYAYTWSTDRLWYKNRMQLQPHASASNECQGIDMNRNWGYQWNASGDGLSGGPQDPCSHWYPGAYPFQAPEVTAIANYISRTPKIRGFLDLRSYGQQLMYPYSYSCEHVAPHAENLIEAALGATKALRETHGVPYTSGASCELLYPAPGNIIDWMYGEAGVKYSYSLMLRDTGTYGFLLPPRYIQPVGEETAAAVKSLAKFIEDVGM